MTGPSWALSQGKLTKSDAKIWQLAQKCVSLAPRTEAMTAHAETEIYTFYIYILT